MSKSCSIACSCCRLRRLFLAGLLALAAFVLVVKEAYLPTRQRPDDAVARERKAYLVQLEAEQERLATTYGWEDKAKGIVRLPIERAMELTLQELQPPSAKHE